jgi:hypothetical protein
MEEGTFTPAEAGRMLAAAGLGVSETFATDRVRRLHRVVGVLKPCGRDTRGGNPAYRFSLREIAAAALLFRVMDGAQITAPDHLRFLRDQLELDCGRGPLLDQIFGDIANGGEPMLWLIQWQSPSGGDRCTTFSYRLTGEREPIPHPGGDVEPILEANIPLAALFSRFIGANVVSLPKLKAVG